jgi:hypothetical protein
MLALGDGGDMYSHTIYGVPAYLRLNIFGSSAIPAGTRLIIYGHKIA